MSKLKLLCQRLSKLHKDAPSAPGVIVSYLPNGQWYIAIHTFTEKFGKGREVVAKAMHTDLDEAFNELLLLTPVPLDEETTDEC